ncbi:MAG: dihydrofolate reductase [Candidatus Paceibacterota bacterium]|jgi:dihydrofolate reductase
MNQTISLIVAVGKGGVIGNKGKIPWHLPADFAYFKKITFGRPIIMGDKTHDSIGRILPGRKNIVLSLDKEYQPKAGAFAAHSIEEALELAGDGEAFIVGGGQIYKIFFPKADRVYLTLVSGKFEGDAFFPEIKKSEWKEISKKRKRKDKKNSHAMTWKVYERVKK